MSNTASSILQAWIYGGLFTADELADAGEVSDSMFAKYRTGERSMPFEVAARVSRFAQARRGRCELASLLCDSAHVVVPAGAPAPDGRIQDEVCASVVSLGDLAQLYEADDLDGAKRAAEELIRQAHAALAEVALRRGRTST